MNDFCLTPGLALRLGVDFVFRLSQQQEQQQKEQEEEPPPKSKLEFDTEDLVLCVFISIVWDGVWE